MTKDREKKKMEKRRDHQQPSSKERSTEKNIKNKNKKTTRLDAAAFPLPTPRSPPQHPAHSLFSTTLISSVMWPFDVSSGVTCAVTVACVLLSMMSRGASRCRVLATFARRGACAPCASRRCQWSAAVTWCGTQQVASGTWAGERRVGYWGYWGLKCLKWSDCRYQ